MSSDRIKTNKSYAYKTPQAEGKRIVITSTPMISRKSLAMHRNNSKSPL